MRPGPSVIPDHLLAGTTELLSPTSSVFCQLVHFSTAGRREDEDKQKSLASISCGFFGFVLLILNLE